MAFLSNIPEAPLRTETSFPSTSIFRRSIAEMFSTWQNPSSLWTEILLELFSLALTTWPHKSEWGLVRNASSSASPRAKLWHLMFFLLLVRQLHLYCSLSSPCGCSGSCVFIGSFVIPSLSPIFTPPSSGGLPASILICFLISSIS